MQIAVQRRDFVVATLAEGKKVAGLDADRRSGARRGSGRGEDMASPVKSRLMSYIRSEGKGWCLTKIRFRYNAETLSSQRLRKKKQVAGLDAHCGSGTCTERDLYRSR